MNSSERAIEHWSRQKEFFSGKPNSSGGGQSKELTDLIHAVEAATVYEACYFHGKETVLDIGAGGGRWSMELADKVRRITAIEPSELFDVLVENAGDKDNIFCRKISFEDFSDKQQFDLVIVSGVLMYLIKEEEVEGFLSKVAKLLVPGGKLLMREPVASRDRTVINWKIHPAETVDSLDNCKYWERIRPETVYISHCHNSGLELKESFPSHAPFFRSLPHWLKLFKPVIEPMAGKFFTVNNLDKVLAYNAWLRRSYRKIQDLFSLRAFRIYIFEKSLLSV